MTATRNTTDPLAEADTDEPVEGGRRMFSRGRLIAIAAALVVVAIGAAWLFAFSSVFGVKTVTVRGSQPLSATQELQIRTAADIAHGTPLLRLDTAAIARRVEALPDIASAGVRTSYPSTVFITVALRVAIGVVHTSSGYALVDQTGDQFRTVSAAPKGLPLFVVPNGADARTSGGAVATVAAALSPALRARIASIQALDPNEITVLLIDGRVVRWGSADQSAAKARVLPALLARPGRQFDVSDPDQPFAR